MIRRIVLAGCNHKTAPVELRERLSLYGRSPLELLHNLRSVAQMEECAALSTCNRTEIYGISDDADWEETLLNYLAHQADERPGALQPHLYFNEGATAVRHLFQVASGLDSMVPGEGQILGQVRDTLRQAEEAGSAGTLVRALLESALACGKRARTETGIGRGAVSISMAAVQLAQQIFENLKGSTVLLIGAGETAESAARIFSELPGKPSLLVCNRSSGRAEELAGALSARAVSWDDRVGALRQADVVIASTGSPTPVISAAEVQAARRGRRGKPLFLIDIAVPRDIDPAAADLDDVYLYNIDDLQSVIDENLSLRQGEAAQVGEIVDQEVHRFQVWLASLDVGPTIKQLQLLSDAIVAGEWNRVGSRLGHLSQRDRETVDTLVRGVVNKLIRPTILHLREAASDGNGYRQVEQVRTIFGLSKDQPEEME